MRDATASESVWDAAELDGANLDRGNFRGSSFHGANCGSAFLGDSILDGANLDDVRVARSLYGGLPGVAAAGDELLIDADAAEKELLERLFPQIQRAARIAAVVRQMDADELASEAALALLSRRALKSLLTASPQEKSRYVHWIVTSIALAAQRRSHREASVSSDVLADLPDPQQGQLEQAIQAELGDRLRTVIGQLSPNVQRIIRLRFFEDMTIAEIAAHEGLSRSSVHYRLRSGVRRISEMVASDWAQRDNGTEKIGTDDV